MSGQDDKSQEDGAIEEIQPAKVMEPHGLAKINFKECSQDQGDNQGNARIFILFHKIAQDAEDEGEQDITHCRALGIGADDRQDEDERF